MAGSYTVHETEQGNGKTRYDYAGRYRRARVVDFGTHWPCGRHNGTLLIGGNVYGVRYVDTAHDIAKRYVCGGDVEKELKALSR